MTIKEIRRLAEENTTIEEAKAFEEEMGMTMEEFFTFAESNPLYAEMAEMLFEIVDED